MNDQLVTDEDGRIWTVKRPKSGGIVLTRPGGGMKWIGSGELAKLRPAGLEDLRSQGGKLVRR